MARSCSPVLGNHDVSDGNGDAHAAAIGMPNRWYATEIGDLLVVSLDSAQPDDPDQLAWLESTLRGTDAAWIIATMHHPPYSGGYHGSSIDVRNAFSPLFERFGVQLVLAGHDHDYQRSKPLDGVTYAVTLCLRHRTRRQSARPRHRERRGTGTVESSTLGAPSSGGQGVSVRHLRHWSPPTEGTLKESESHLKRRPPIRSRLASRPDG